MRYFRRQATCSCASVATRRRQHLGCCASLLLLLCFTLAIAGTLWEEERQRLTIGMRLFPAVLAADLNLSQRRDADGQLQVLILHDGQHEAAAQVQRALQALASVQQHPLEVQIVTLEQLSEYPQRPIAAIFVAAPIAQRGLYPRLLSDYSTLTFSPFDGDVERGAVAGIRITDRILPLVNLEQAEQAAIAFKPFFLRVAATR